MDKDRLKIGDLVQLRSGGPIMTVGSKGIGSHLVRCAWFTESKTIDSHDFEEEMLVGPLEIRFHWHGELAR